MMNRNQSIDLLKVIAMLMVLALHTGVRRHYSICSYSNFPEIYMIAGIAIPIFFMCSGYLMSFKETVGFNYSLRKILGILKFCLVICVSYDLLHFIHSGVWEFSFPKCFIQRGTFGVFWYFGSMIVIYAIMPLLLKIIHGGKLKRYILVLAFFLFVIFVLNCTLRFEKHIIQSFRLWNHIFYFLCGAYIRLYSDKFKYIDYKACLLFCVLFVLSGKIFQVGGNEYHFSSLLCMLYAISLFVCVERLSINSNIVSKLSLIFLPVYSLHDIILAKIFNYPYIMPYIDKYISIIPFAFLTEYIIASTLCIVVGLAIMKFTIMNKIFKI